MGGRARHACTRHGTACLPQKLDRASETHSPATGRKRLPKHLHTPITCNRAQQENRSIRVVIGGSESQHPTDSCARVLSAAPRTAGTLRRYARLHVGFDFAVGGQGFQVVGRLRASHDAASPPKWRARAVSAVIARAPCTMLWTRVVRQTQYMMCNVMARGIRIHSLTSPNQRLLDITPTTCRGTSVAGDWRRAAHGCAATARQTGCLPRRRADPRGRWCRPPKPQLTVRAWTYPHPQPLSRRRGL